MMDFLRRLAPPRDNDATRATAVLPSRFASEPPLRMTAAQVQSDLHIDDETALALDTQTTPASISASPHPPQPFSQTHHARVELERLDSEPTRGDREKVESAVRGSTPLDAQAVATDTGAAPERGDADLEHRDSIDTHRVAPEPASEPAAPRTPAPSAPSYPAMPLSQAALAQRTQQPREPDEVIHVSIGRIEVIAQSSPAPAARRALKPRTATVTLADYLRGGNGSRR